MKRTDGSDEAKRNAGESAAALAESGTTVGLGTGSTAAHAIRAIGRAIEEGLSVRGVPTSFGARVRAIEAGIELCGLDESTPSLAIDGADQVAGDALIKGGGAAHAREKVVAAAADRFVVVIDETKRADVLDLPIPIEVLPDARSVVAGELRDLGGKPTLRTGAGKDGPVVTDNGNLVLDCTFGAIEAPEDLATVLAAIPGCVEHGLFCGMADELHVGTDAGVEVIERNARGARR